MFTQDLPYGVRWTYKTILTYYGWRQIKEKNGKVGMSWSRLDELSQDSMENAGYKQSSTQKSEIVRTHTANVQPLFERACFQTVDSL